MVNPIKKEVVIGDCRLLLGDCLTIMPTLGKFDLCLADPPYGIDENHKKIASRGKLAKPVDYGVVDWDKVPVSPEAIALMREISKHQIIFGGNYFDLPPSSCWLIWDKRNGTNDFADCELAWTNLDKAVRKIDWLWNGMIRKGSDIRIHPTQKPVGVMQWCLSHVPKAQTIIDPYAACRRLEAEYKTRPADMFIEADKPKPLETIPMEFKA